MNEKGTQVKGTEPNPPDAVAQAPAAPEVAIVMLAQAGPTALVQWFEGETERRGFLPVAVTFEKSALPADVLARATPYGVPWARVLNINVTVERLEAALHGAGLWTPADVQAHPDRALSALQAAYGIDLGALLTAAANYSKEA